MGEGVGGYSTILSQIFLSEPWLYVFCTLRYFSTVGCTRIFIYAELRQLYSHFSLYIFCVTSFFVISPFVLNGLD